MPLSKAVRRRILIVEDSPLDVKLVEQALSEMTLPIDLTVVSDGEAAATFLTSPEALAIDLVLLDLNLPLKNGMDVLTETRALPALKFLPIIVYTTSSDDHHVGQAYAKGATAFLRKPIDALEFMDHIQIMLRFWFQAATLPFKSPIP